MTNKTKKVLTWTMLIIMLGSVIAGFLVYIIH